MREGALRVAVEYGVLDSIQIAQNVAVQQSGKRTQRHFATVVYLGTVGPEPRHDGSRQFVLLASSEAHRLNLAGLAHGGRERHWRLPKPLGALHSGCAFPQHVEYRIRCERVGHAGSFMKMHQWVLRPLRWPNRGFSGVSA